MTAHTPQKNAQFNKDHVLTKYHESRMSWPGSSSYHQQLNTYLLSAFPKEQDVIVLDDMCGTGVFLPTLQDHYCHVVGMDLSFKALRFVEVEAPFLTQGDAVNLPFADATFDLVFVRGGLHHVPRIAQAVAEIARVLKPGGQCAFLEPREDNQLIHIIRRTIYHTFEAFDPDEEHGLTRKEMHGLVNQSGMQIIHEEPYGLLGFALFCNPDTLRFTRFFSFMPGAARLAVWMSKLDRAMNQLPLVRAFAFETFMIARKG